MPVGPSNVILRSRKFSQLYKAWPELNIIEHDLFDPGLLETLKVPAGSAAHDRLLALQRLLRIHPAESVANALYDDGLRSAQAIARVPADQFVARYSERLAEMVTARDPGEFSREIHEQAVAVAAKSAHAFADISGLLSPQVRGSALSNASPELAAELQRLPSFDDLFGSQNFLGCADCGSIFGPAAYFTDLMRIVDRYITDVNDSQIPKGMKLEDRRPDLFRTLKLDCAATNDPVDYLTLVNEILATLADPGLTLSAPRVLATAEYPFCTPFNLPLIEIRQALGQLGTSLEETWSASPVPAHAGLAQAWQGVRLKLDEDASGDAGAYDRMEVVAADGLAAGQRRRIVSYDGSDRTAILDRPFNPAPAAPPRFLIYDPLAGSREALNVTGELLALLLAPPAGKDDPASLSAAYGVADVRDHLPRPGAGTVTVAAGSADVTLAGAEFTEGDLGNQILIGEQLRTVVRVDARSPRAIVDAVWDSDASGAYVLFPFAGFDRAEVFAQRAGLTLDQLRMLLRQGLSDEEVKSGVAQKLFINSTADAREPMRLVLDQRDPGNTVERIANLTFDRLDRMHRFIRLAGASGVGYAELDWAMHLSGACTAVTPAAISALALLTTVAERTGMSMATAAAFLGDLKTTGRGEGAVPADPFDRIYNNPVLLGGKSPYAPGSTTPFDPARAPIWQYVQHTPEAEALRKRLGAALGLGDDELAVLAAYCARLVADPAPESLTLDLPLLSRLYRIVTAARLTRWSVRDLVQLIESMDSPPPDDLGVLTELLDLAAWIDGGPFSLDDVLTITIPAAPTEDQLRDIRVLGETQSGSAVDLAVTPSSFQSAAIEAGQSADLFDALENCGVLNRAGILADVVLGHALATTLFPYPPGAFISEGLIDEKTSAEVAEALVAHDPPYLSRPGYATRPRANRRRASGPPAPAFLTTAYEPDVDLEFLFSPDIPARAEMIAQVRGRLSRGSASIGHVLTVLIGAAAAQDTLAVQGTARFLSLDPQTFIATLRIATGRESVAGYRQDLLTPLPAADPLPAPLPELFSRLWRGQRWVSRLAFTPAELTALLVDKAAFGVVDPQAPSVGDLRSMAWFRSLTGRFGDTRDELVGYLTGTGTDLAAPLASLTGWDRAQIAVVIDAVWPSGDNAAQPPRRSVASVALLSDCFALAMRIGADVQSLLGFGALKRLPASTGWAGYEAAARATLGMLAAHYGPEAFSEAHRTYSGVVDTAYRDALLGYVLWSLPRDGCSGLAGPDDLYARLLIDVQMSSCDVTTRIAQAINSVQLYLQRCRLGLEDGITNLQGIAPAWWEWMSSYRVWEANRKVFLYPENYLDPSLRRNASPEFDGLRQDLMQTRVSEASATAVYGSYFQGLTDLAALVPCAAFEDVTPGPAAADRVSTLYLLARTRTAPYTYYYLTRTDGERWTPWRKIDLTINSAFVTPIVAFDKLFIFWSEKDTIKSSAVAASDGSTGTTAIKVATETQTVTTATLRYSFQTLTGAWTSPQTLAENVPMRVLPQTYEAFKKYKDLAGLFDPADLFWLQPQVAKVARGLHGRARVRLFNEPRGGPVAGEGVVTVTAGSPQVIGNGTRFAAQLSPGYKLTVNGEERQVVAIRGGDQLVVDQAFERSREKASFSFTATTGKVIGMAGPYYTETSFTSQVTKGDAISCDAQLGVVTLVDNDRELTMNSPWAWPADSAEYKIVPQDPQKTRFQPFPGPGTIEVSDKDDGQVIGTGTQFRRTISVGDQIFCEGVIQTVKDLQSDTRLEVYQGWPIARKGASYTVLPQQQGWECLLVQLGPPLDVSRGFEAMPWQDDGNPGDDPYLDALDRLNSGIAESLQYCEDIRNHYDEGQVGAGVGFLIDADLNVKDARFFIAPDERPHEGGQPFAGALDRNNSAVIAVAVTNSLGGEYWLNTSAGYSTPVLPTSKHRVDLLYNISRSAGLRNVGNVPGVTLFDNGDEAFLLESQEPGSWPVAARISVMPEVRGSRSDLDHRIDTGPYAPRPLGVAGASFAVTRLTTSTIGALARRLSARGVAGLLTPDSQRTPEVPFSRFYRTPQAGPPRALDAGHLPPDAVSFTGPFGLYQREIFFHTPFLIAGLLTANARFEEAKTWYQYIFDPTAPTSPADLDGTDRFWRYLPFRGITIPALRAVLTDPAGVRAYNDDPFDPFAIAEVRTSAYAKAVVMRYIENIIAWGDALFGQDTRESVSQAANMYLMASELLGPRPRRLGQSPVRAVKTFGAIRDEYRGRKENIPQFLIELENTSLGRLATGERRYVSTPINDINAYFCVPGNSVLDGYWDLIDDRLGKIRACQSLQGTTRILAPFAPPLDVRALVADAAARGGHLAEPAAQATSFRFTTLIAHARELAGQVSQFGAELLAVLERKDSEDLAMIQTRQQTVILELTTAVRRGRVDELLAVQDALTKALSSARYRQDYYQGLARAGLIPAEIENLRESERVLFFNLLAGTAQVASSIAFTFPNLGSPFAITYGGIQIGNALQAASSVFQLGSTLSSFKAERAQVVGGYARRAAEWEFLAGQADHDAAELEAQLAANQFAIEAATRELATHVRMIEQSRAIEGFLRGKFTSSELYGWMIRQLSSLYFQLFTLACATARQAERAYQLEVGSSRRFITSAAWDDARRGLLAGESLTLAVGQLQQAYLQEHVRAYEIERTVSLLELDPPALVQLRGTGECVFTLPERLFDQDFPGHYRRTITSVAVTIPALTGPYQNVRGTLTQLGSQIVMQPSNAAVAYLLGVPNAEPPGPDVLRSNVRAGQSIAISTGVNDDGVFDASRADERYLPFERTGAVSQWRLCLPFASNQLDFAAISDIALTVRYTAFDGGGRFRREVQGLLPSYHGRCFVSLARQYAADWYKFFADPEIDAGTQVLRFQLPGTLLPPHVDPRAARVTAFYLAVVTSAAFQPGPAFVAITPTPGASQVEIPFRGAYSGTAAMPADSGPLLRELVTESQKLGFALRKTPAAFLTQTGDRLRADVIDDLQLVVDFEGPVTWPPVP